MALKLKIATIGCCLLTTISCSYLVYNHYPRVFPWLTSIPLIGWFIAYNFPPHDFYTPLTETNLSEGVHILSFIGKYEGRHEVQISPIIVPSLYENNVAMCVQGFNSKNELLFNQENASSRILGGKLVDGVNVYNYCYGIFFAPEDFPLGESITLRIECRGDIQAILKRNPSANIKIVKVFDK